MALPTVYWLDSYANVQTTCHNALPWVVGDLSLSVYLLMVRIFCRSCRLARSCTRWQPGDDKEHLLVTVTAQGLRSRDMLALFRQSSASEKSNSQFSWEMLQRKWRIWWRQADVTTRAISDWILQLCHGWRMLKMFSWKISSSSFTIHLACSSVPLVGKQRKKGERKKGQGYVGRSERTPVSILNNGAFLAAPN